MASGRAATTILLVGHERRDRTAVKLVLQQVGYMVLEATSALQAFCLGVSRASEIGLLLTDVALPNITGEQLVEKFSQSFPAIPALLISEQPVQPEALLGKVREVLGPPNPIRQGPGTERSARRQRVACG